MAEPVTLQDLLDLTDPIPPAAEVLACQIVFRLPNGLIQTFNLGRVPAPPMRQEFP